MKTRLTGAVALILAQMGLVACDKMALMAPTESTVSVTTADLVLPTGGRTEVTAFVAESSGNPVQNGTVVRFSTTLGRLAPEEVQTRNGLALTTFLAGDISGIAAVRAISGSAGGATGGEGAAANTTNVVQITIGAAAVGTVTVRANPAFVPFAGGTVEIVAIVLTADARPLSGIPVTFSTIEGQLSAGSAITDAAGEARTSLTTTRAATVTARAGTQDGTAAIVRREAPPITTVTMSGTPANGTPLGQSWTFTAFVVTTGETNESRAVSFKWDFGDDTTLTTNGNVATHVYTIGNVRRTVTVEVTMSDNQRVSASIDIIVPALPLPTQ